MAHQSHQYDTAQLTPEAQEVGTVRDAEDVHHDKNGCNLLSDCVMENATAGPCFTTTPGQLQAQVCFSLPSATLLQSVHWCHIHIPSQKAQHTKWLYSVHKTLAIPFSFPLLHASCIDHQASLPANPNPAVYSCQSLWVSVQVVLAALSQHVIQLMVLCQALGQCLSGVIKGAVQHLEHCAIHEGSKHLQE